MTKWVLVLFFLFAPAQAAELPLVGFPMTKSGVTFTTPSMNIECSYTPRGGTDIYRTKDGLAELFCDRAEPTYIRFVLSERGPATMIRSPGEQPCCGTENPLPYGRAWEVAPFRCESAETGLTCRRTDGPGFFISRASVRVF